MRQRILKPLAQRCKVIATSGLAPRELAGTVCLGAALGVLPLLWGTSLICLWLGRRLRLNHLVLQSVNYLLYPLQLTLLLPFCRLGRLLLPWGPELAPEQLLSIPVSGVAGLLPLLAWLSFKALLAWLITVPPVVLLLYLLLARLPQRTGSGSAVVAGL